MANAAPLLATPVRRLIAGLIDLFVLLFFVILAIALVGDNRASVITVVALFTYGLYHAAFLSTLGGGTPGLRALNIRIVAAGSGAELSAVQIFVRAAFRPVLLYTVGWTAFEIDPQLGILFSLLAAPILFEAGLMFTLPTRQTLADIVSRTMVINVPPPEPHRAPAGPLYSASDAEFGVRPRR